MYDTFSIGRKELSGAGCKSHERGLGMISRIMEHFINKHKIATS